MVSHSYRYTKPYLPKTGEYGEYYARSKFSGTQLPAYGGVRRQHGHSIFGSFVMAELPMLKQLGKSALCTVGSKVSSVVTGLINDLLPGKNLKNSLLDRTKSAAR